MAYFVGSTAALDADNTWTSPTKLRERHDSVQGTVFADQGGSLYIEQSPDGTNWDVSAEYTIAASDGKGFSENLVAPFWRIRFVNGSTPQTTFRITATTQAGGDS